MADQTVRTFRRSFKYRLYPTKAQATQFESWLNLCRELHNAAIEERRENWRGLRISVRYQDQSRQLPGIKEVRSEFREIDAQVLQQVLHRVDLAFKAFFRRVKSGQTPGYPRFRSRDRYDSFTFPQGRAFHLVGTKKLHLSKLGDIRIKLHRAIEGKPKTLTIKREAGHWYAIFSCDAVPARAYPAATAEVGIDVGLESFATLSTGEKIENPRWYRRAEERIGEAQRGLAKKQRGSQCRRQAKAKLARLCAKAANQRRDFQHKLAHRIVTKNRLIAVEDLAVKEMTEKSTSGLSKSIHDASWAQFLAILSGKAEEAGRTFVKVPPKGTSSTCFRCGTYRKKSLSEREHRCSCGLVLDRDLHASLNILRLGRSLRDSA